MNKLFKTFSILAAIAIFATACGTQAAQSPPEEQAASQAVTNETVLNDATPETPATLKPRVIFPKPASTTVDPEQVSAGQIILKFHEGTHIRLRSGVLTFDSKQVTPAERLLLDRVDLSDEQIQGDLSGINQILDQDPPFNILRLFFLQDEDQLAGNKVQGETMSGEELADLDLYYTLIFEAPDVSRAEDLINRLNHFPSVEIAYPQPIPQGADGDIPPTTVISPPLSQGYLNQAPGGIDAIYAWTYPGGRGAGVKLVDVEAGWHLDHEDLPAPNEYFFGNGLNLGDESHGTAVLGVIAARDNGFGAIGIAPDASIGWSSSTLVSFPNFVYFVAAGIDKAASVLAFGDVLLIEQHFQGWDGGVPCPNTCGCSQYAYAPVENWTADFDAIKNATARGIIVVEAAGNGQMNLDAAHYAGRFDRTVRDSGAILVGAGSASTPHSPLCFTNFGSRVDVQGWGGGVQTLGWGGPPSGPADPTLRMNGGDARQWYTRSFNGTSSASPIVAGAVCSIQGILIAKSLPKLGPQAMRALLSSTGTLQSSGTSLSTPIGPLPDLRKAIHSILPQSAEFVSQTVPLSMSQNQISSISITMKNSGTTTWPPGGSIKLGSQNGVDNTIWGVNRISVPNQVVPGAQVTFNFTITAPSKSSTYNFQWRMGEDSADWFGDLTPNIIVTVNPDWHDNDLSLRASEAPDAPPVITMADSNPMGYVFANIQHTVFRAADGHIHELWWESPGIWHDKDLTKETAAPLAAGDPMGYVFADVQHVVFRATDGHIHELSWSPNPAKWQDKDLTKETSAPLAAGDPMGYIFADTQHVVFRATDGHIHELWWSRDPLTWYDKDLTKEAVAPLAAGDPMGYVFADIQHVVFRATNGHIHELWWKPNPATWYDKDLTQEAVAPMAAGDPMGYVFADIQHVVFRATDGHIHELWWKPNPATWYDKDLTKEAGAPMAAGEPMGYVFADIQHVVFQATDGHIHELWWKPNPATWYDNDLSGRTGASMASSDSMGYVFANLQHVVFRTADGHIHELWWG